MRVPIECCPRRSSSVAFSWRRAPPSASPDRPSIRATRACRSCARAPVPQAPSPAVRPPVPRMAAAGHRVPPPAVRPAGARAAATRRSRAASPAPGTRAAARVASPMSARVLRRRRDGITVRDLGGTTGTTRTAGVQARAVPGRSRRTARRGVFDEAPRFSCVSRSAVRRSTARVAPAGSD